MSERALRWEYLDLEGQDLVREAGGVSVADGRVSLAVVPAGPESLGDDTESAGDVPALRGPAGVGVDRDGHLYVSDGAAGTVLRIDGCDGTSRPLRCVPLLRPGGVAVGRRGELYIADSGNNRIVVVDLASGQTIGVWGTADPYGEPRPGSAPGLLDEPTDVAVDSQGFVYVADRGNRRVQRFTSDGAVDAAFWERLSHARISPRSPNAVAMLADGDEERLLVLDHRAEGRLRVLVYGVDGALDADRTGQMQAEARRLPKPLEHGAGGIAAGSGGIYVGDPAGRRILAFDATGAYVGAISSPVAGLGLDCQGRLVVHTSSGALTRFADAGPVAAGALRTGPFPIPGDPEDDRLIAVRAAVDALPEGAGFRLYGWLGADGAEPPPLPEAGEDGGENGWVVGDANAAELVVAGAGVSTIWLGLRLSAGGAGGPVLGRLRVVTGLESWLNGLPAVYQEDENRDFLRRLLALLGSGLEEEEALMEGLTLLFDADAAPDGPQAAWLDWLSGWLAFDLAAVREPAARRRAVAEAFALSGRRGTVDGLRRLIDLTIGAEAWVSEPAARAELWRLDGSMSLGLDTALVPAEAQGAVLGTTATLDASHLIRDDEIGVPLYDDLAYRFCVGVFARDVAAPGAREALERLVEHERPAHTVAHICVVEPRARVGFQARIGVDAIVGAGAPALLLGEAELGSAEIAQRIQRQPVVGTAAVGHGGRGG